ncbi:MAG TPA: methyltransferase domain-containing protein [Bryobacteraceae bacterium]|nr:methyltransferase domain-containing protein [Bryobacteraceae bacterium]
MVEFTGERVIPGQVNDDLWSEHIARYAFARRYAEGRRVLDAGCGTGYGSAELAQSAAVVTGLDVAPEAIEFSRATYPIPNLRFVVSSCAATPFPENAFDLVVAFEVIEHLSDQRAFLQECARVLTHHGLFIVSSPNRKYYAETRAKTGPNPYHVHEFVAQEFVEELSSVFQNVRLVLQNRIESFAFHPASSFWPAEARIDGGGGSAEDAHFLIGLCSFGPLPEPTSFVYVPRAANLLREREQHVQLLEQQLIQTKKWLADTQTERNSLLDLFRKLNAELEDRTHWAERLNAELEASGQRIVALQNELDTVTSGYEAKVNELEAESRSKTEWALATEARLLQELEALGRELAKCVRLLETAEATVEERTLWAQRVEAQREKLATQLSFVRASRWVKLGRKIGVGPLIEPQ